MTIYSPKTNALAANAVLEAAVDKALRNLALVARTRGILGPLPLIEREASTRAEATLLAAAQSAELLLERAS